MTAPRAGSTEQLSAMLRALATDRQLSGSDRGRVAVLPSTLILAADRLDLLTELLRHAKGERGSDSST